MTSRSPRFAGSAGGDQSKGLLMDGKSKALLMDGLRARIRHPQSPRRRVSPH
jgi:hypothetical protein